MEQVSVRKDDSGVFLFGGVSGCPCMQNTRRCIKKSDVGPVLRENFSWKDEDFSWAKDAIALSPALKNEFRPLYEGFLSSDFKEEVLSTIKKFTTGDEAWYFQHLKEIPSECKAYKEIHNIMLPNKRKSIIHRIYFYIDTFFSQ
ncbi:hypothetical protein [Bartonella sp. C271]|uniref:hypothetical protein n=1 Tax=Bartonella sp. C271 TaxID=3070220 RepID=UPI0038B59B55